nr:bacterial transcriptional activator domain-containing protein [Nocardia bovistercoris]
MRKLRVPPDAIDVHRLARIAARSEEVRGTEQRDLLLAALELRHGEPLEGLAGNLVEEYRSSLVKQYRRLEIQFNQLEVRSGRGSRRLRDLERIYEQDPTDTRTTGLYMSALYYDGNPIQALDVYRDHFRHLKEMNIDVTQNMRNLQSRILSEAADLGPVVEPFIGGPYRPEAEQQEEFVQESPAPQREKSEEKALRPQQIVRTRMDSVNVSGGYVNFGFDQRGAG